MAVTTTAVGTQVTTQTWTAVPEPFAQVARLAGHVAFDQDAVRVTAAKESRARL